MYSAKKSMTNAGEMEQDACMKSTLLFGIVWQTIWFANGIKIDLKDTTNNSAKNKVLFYAADQRPQIREDDPSLSMVEVTKVIAQLWRELDDEDIIPYQDKANEASSAYSFYAEDQRPQIREDDTSLSMVEVTKVNAQLWRELDDEDKIP